MGMHHFVASFFRTPGRSCRCASPFSWSHGSHGSQWGARAVARCICCAAKKSSSFAWLIMQPGMIVWSLHDLFQEKAKGEIVKARCAEALIGGLSRLVVGMYGMYALYCQRFITPQDLAVQGRLRRFSDLSLLSLPVPATPGVELRSQKQSFRRKRCQGGGRWTDEQMNEAQQSLINLPSNAWTQTQSCSWLALAVISATPECQDLRFFALPSVEGRSDQYGCVRECWKGMYASRLSDCQNSLGEGEASLPWNA